MWRVIGEMKLLILWFIGAFPMGTGEWLRARCLPFYLKSLGRNTAIQHGFWVTTPRMVEIGSNCSFGQRVFITGAGGVRIGDWVGLGPDVKIWSVSHRFSEWDRPWLLQGFDFNEVVIEDDVWLAANVFVMPGTTIGRGAIVAAGSVVNKSVPPYALFAGNPGRVVGWRKRPDAVASEKSASSSADDGAAT
jgi:acetyltransferase-like isoleucine patch superfamily enzyme